MYRIQAFNKSDQAFRVFMVKTFDQRNEKIKELLSSGHYSEVGITFEWLSRV